VGKELWAYGYCELALALTGGWHTPCLLYAEIMWNLVRHVLLERTPVHARCERFL
jgi:hypothetical protein